MSDKRPPADRITMRLEPAERADWVAAAERAGMSLSSYVRTMVRIGEFHWHFDERPAGHDG